MKTPIAAAAFLCLASGFTSIQAQTLADNSKQNSNDKSVQALTPMDQSESRSDITITADIRKAVMKEQGLSTAAKNVKIITSGGKVTLRGAVKTEDEKASIARLANSEAGVVGIDNQLSVTN